MDWPRQARPEWIGPRQARPEWIGLDRLGLKRDWPRRARPEERLGLDRLGLKRLASTGSALKRFVSSVIEINEYPAGILNTKAIQEITERFPRQSILIT